MRDRIYKYLSILTKFTQVGICNCKFMDRNNTAGFIPKSPFGRRIGVPEVYGGVDLGGEYYTLAIISVNRIMIQKNSVKILPVIQLK